MSSQILHAHKSPAASLHQRLSSKLGLTIAYAIPSAMSVAQTQDVIQRHLVQEITRGNDSFFGYKRRYRGSCVDGSLELHGPFVKGLGRKPLRLLTRGRLVDASVGCVLQLQIKIAPDVAQINLYGLLFYIVAIVAAVYMLDWFSCIAFPVDWFSCIAFPVQIGFLFLAIQYQLNNEALIVRNLLRDMLIDAG